jgi:hypothetical protein
MSTAAPRLPRPTPHVPFDVKTRVPSLCAGAAAFLVYLTIWLLFTVRPRGRVHAGKLRLDMTGGWILLVEVQVVAPAVLVPLSGGTCGTACAAVGYACLGLGLAALVYHLAVTLFRGAIFPAPAPLAHNPLVDEVPAAKVRSVCLRA